LFDFKKLHPTFPEKHMKTFLELIPKKVFMIFDLCGRNFVGKYHKTFQASLGKFWQKSFAPLEICLLLNLCTSTDFQTKTGWHPDTKETENHLSS